MRNDDYPEVPRTLAVALTFWAVAVLAGTLSDVFLRLPVEVVAVLGAFAASFAVSVVMLDARVGGWLDRRGAQSAWLALAGIAALLVTAGVTLSVAESPAEGIGSIAAAPWAPLLLFGVPVTLALLVAAARARRREVAERLSSPASTAPARRRVATSGSRTSVASGGAARARAAG